MQKDSVYFRDSTYVFNNGTLTIYKEYHNAYRLAGSIDTIYRVRNDTVRVNLTAEQLGTVTEESWLSKTLKRIGVVSIVILLIVFVSKIKSFF